MLCSRCEKNVSSGKTTQEGTEVIKTIYQMSKNIKSLNNISIEKVLVFGDLIVIQCPKSDVPNVVGKDGRIVNSIKTCFGKQVKIIGNDDHRSMLSSLFFPAKLSGVDRIYTDNNESLRIRIEKNQLRVLPSKKEDLIKVAEEITGMNMELSIV